MVFEECCIVLLIEKQNNNFSFSGLSPLFSQDEDGRPKVRCVFLSCCLPEHSDFYLVLAICYYYLRTKI